jgi:probable phosphoglycerate mutase
MVRLVLVRHGETAWTLSGQHTSRTDIPLTEAGEHDAAALREPLAVFDVVRVLSSSRVRAQDTCRLAGLGDRMEIDADLAEWDYGDYEGRTTTEIRQERPGWSIFDQDPPGGETAEQVGRRCDAVIARATADGGREEGDVVLFSHGHLLRVLAARWVGLPPGAGRHLALSPGSISVLGHEREVPVVERWNTTR